MAASRHARWATHDPVAIDHEGGAPVEAERPEDPVGLPDRLAGVGEEREGEATLLAREPVVAGHRLRAEREDLGARLAERSMSSV